MIFTNVPLKFVRKKQLIRINYISNKSFVYILITHLFYTFKLYRYAILDFYKYTFINWVTCFGNFYTNTRYDHIWRAFKFDFPIVIRIPISFSLFWAFFFSNDFKYVALKFGSILFSPLIR